MENGKVGGWVKREGHWTWQVAPGCGGVTLGELVRDGFFEPPRAEDGDRWGPWTYRAKGNLLVHDDGREETVSDTAVEDQPGFLWTEREDDQHLAAALVGVLRRRLRPRERAPWRGRFGEECQTAVTRRER
jgi:hypothetical protein